MELSPSGHLDGYARSVLPPHDQWPQLEFTLPELQYPQQLNAAAELIDRAVEQFGAERNAILLPGGGHWTYGELQRRANQFARVLTEDHGVVPGNRVLLRMNNSPWAVAFWLGTLKAGGIVATTMVAWKSHEFEQLLRKVRPTVAIVDHDALQDISEVLEDHVPVNDILIFGGESNPLVHACASKPDTFTAVETASDDVALMSATSGTTGEAKVTMHFHRDILANADTFAKHTLQLSPTDVSASTAPLAFTFGLGGLVVFPLRTGGASVLMDRSGPIQLAQLIDELGITVLYTAPTGYRTLIKEGYGDQLSRLRVGVSAGEHLPEQTFRAVEQASGLRLVNGIGATEMLHVFISASGDDIRPGTTGRAVPGYRATILDDDGNELPPGEVGRLAVIGPTGCRYLSDARQSNYVSNGWNVTGDTYVMDEDGYFAFQARTDSVIVTAGYNVGAPEVEDVINLHADVLECAVVGRPDPDKGTIVNAFVVPRDGAAASDELRKSIIDHVKSRLAVYKCPRRIDFVEELPRNPSGKIQHFKLRERAAAESLAVPTL
ncbi:AMP-binding protein [Leucobacter denitrificans]|uniref:AMP-binding protein n=1 Tax=Leucobacter denitrificans TaxID=683042 RepID=A0A7G9S2S6_9MICO|nr:AMP-binding protein [Leucobacter denitrificans]QNN62151.1 AMP-binding protein [Leucobacter denitrificans]